MKKTVILIVLFILSLCSCPSNDKAVKDGKYIIFPNKLYGINWSTVKIYDVIPILQQKNVPFKCYDWDTGKEFSWTGSRKDVEKIGKIETNYFIGSELDASRIDKVEYTLIYPYMAFQIYITMKNGYYNELLESHNKKFGEKNSYVNLKGFGEVGWYASSEDIKQNDVICVELSKRKSENDMQQESVNQNACFLTLQTAGINMENEFRKRTEKK
jgi:hypothetical protein